MATAFLYNDGSFVFSSGDTADSSKTLVASYTGWDTATYSYNSAPWHDDRDAIISVSFEGAVAPLSTAYWFYRCNSLTSLDFSNFDTSNVTDMGCMFDNCTALTSLDVSNFDTSNVTDMGNMFLGCTELTSLDVSNFDTSKVTNMFGMFSGCRSLTSLDLSSFDTSNVTDMEGMFSFCFELTSLNLSNFDTSNVTYMSNMFRSSALTSLDVSNFDTSNVTDMDYMFSGTYLTSLNLSNFNTSNVTTMGNMFNGSPLASLDLSSFDTSNVTAMHGMFGSCTELKTIYVSDRWDTSAVTNSSNMFYYCKKLVGGNGTAYESSIIDVTYAKLDTNGSPGYFTYYFENESSPNNKFGMIKDYTLRKIGEAIRKKGGFSETYLPSEMDEAILTIVTKDDLLRAEETCF